MRLSQYFLPLLKETPKEAQIASHRLMLRAGMIQQSSAGIYSWLPLGKKVLDKIAQIVREEQNRAGAIEIMMPTIQPSELWQESGRYDDYGAEMLRIRDRHERDMLYGPTNEEQVTDIFRTHVRSYKALPLNLYHIQWKFRDEVRPRFGIMRGREFLMKDAYSFDLDAEAARTAQEIHGVGDITPAMMRDGMEALVMTNARMEELGMPGIGPECAVSCADHGGTGQAIMTQWNGTEWVTLTDFIAPDDSVTGPLVLEDSAAYAAEAGIEPRSCPAS